MSLESEIRKVITPKIINEDKDCDICSDGSPCICEKSLNEAINLDDADRDAQQYSNGSMSVKKIPSMIKKRSDKHLHLHMKSYHKEKDGEAFAKRHGYKVSNYVKTPAGSRMNLYKEDVQKSQEEIDEGVGAGKYSAMNLKKARELMSPAKHRKDGIERIMKGMKVTYKQATKFHDDVMKSYGFKPESLDKTLEDLFQEGQIGEFDHLEEGYEAEVKKVLDKKGIDAYFKNGMLMISKRDMNDAVKILKKQDFDMPKVKAEDVSAYTKDIQQHPKLKAAHSDKMQKIKEEEEMQEDKRFGLSQSLVDAVAKIIGGERPEAMNPAQQAAIAIAKKKKGEKPKDEDASNDKSDDGDGLDKVDPKAAKKKFADRKDKDIDNDGDVDSSDKFLHKKRKAIGKAIAKDKEKEEGNAFGKAVTAAKEAGKKEFVFAGKTYQVKEVMKKNGKKEPVDTNPKMAEEVEVEEGMLKVSDFDGKKHAEKAGLKVKMGASSPFGGASATLSGPDDKLIKYAVQHLGGSGKTLKDVQKSLNEAKMTDAQMKKREEIVMSLKKRMSEFEDKYGDKAKDVMYATATKMAMKSA